MEVSNEIKEDIRKTQLELKNAIRMHQIWLARLQEDENNMNIKCKVSEAEKEIVAIGQAQKLVVERLRRELESYQHRLRARNKQVSVDNDNRYVAQQLRDHQMQYRSRQRTVSLLKPSVLNEIQIKTENNIDISNDASDSDIENKSNEKENSNNSEYNENEKYIKKYSQQTNIVQESRSNFVNVLNKAKESLIDKIPQEHLSWIEQRSDSESSRSVLSPTPSPPPLPQQGEHIQKDTFMRLIGLLTHSQKSILEKMRNERRKRSTTSTNRNDFLYGNFDSQPKRKKSNQYPYLQTHSDPPQTRSAKLRKQQSRQKTSREGSPSGPSTENKANWSNSKPSWVTVLPPGLSVEPVYASTKKVCHGCGRNDVPSLLVWCEACSIWQHTGCGDAGRCVGCRMPLPDPSPAPANASAPHLHHQLFVDKVAERKRLQEKNIELCIELRKLEARAAMLKENMDEHSAEKRQLLADQIKTQRNLQKLLDFISQFKDTSLSIRSTSVSESGSEISRGNED